MKRLLAAATGITLLASCAAVLGLPDPMLDDDFARTGEDAASNDGANAGDDGGVVDGDDAAVLPNDGGDGSVDAGDAASCQATCAAKPADLCNSKFNCGTCGHVCDRGCANRDCVERYIFVTSAKFNGAFGGLAGADQKCKEAAMAAGLRGQYRALLSTGQTSARSRLSDSGAPYVNIGLELVAVGADGLFGSHTNYVAFDEKGTAVNETDVIWSGSLGTGAAHPTARCGDWIDGGAGAQGRAGDITGTNGTWLDFTTVGCNTTHAIYCAEE